MGRSTPRKMQKKACMLCTRNCLKIHGCSSPSSSPRLALVPSNCNAASAPVQLSFFKIMLGDFTRVLFVPPKFSQTIAHLIDKQVSIQDSYGKRWRVRVTLVDGSLAFVEGWRNFVLDHAIKAGELVLFKFNNKATLYAQIFATSACERLHYCEKNKRENRKKKSRSILSPENLCSSKNSSRFRDNEENQCIAGEKSRVKKRLIRTVPGNFMTKKISVENADNPQRPQITWSEDLVENLNSCAELIRCNSPTDERATNIEPMQLMDSEFNQEVTLDPPTDFIDSTTFQTSQDTENLTKKIKTPTLMDCHNSSERSQITSPQGCIEACPESQMDHRWAIVAFNEDFNTTHEVNRDAPTQESNASLNNTEIPVARLTLESVNSGKGNTTTSCEDTPNGRNIGKEDSGLLIDVGSTSRNVNDMSKTCSDPVVMKESSAYSEIIFDEPPDVHGEMATCLEGRLIPVKKEAEEPIALDSMDYGSFSFSTYVNAQSFLALPSKLPFRILKSSCNRRVIMLKDPCMKLWPVLYHESNRFLGFTTGWEDFIRANNLRTGDRCDFQLCNAPDAVLQVLISKS